MRGRESPLLGRGLKISGWIGSEISEFHYITLAANLDSILSEGILSHRRAKNVPHESIAMENIQKNRAKVTVPGGMNLHDYANLYFHARNPMMYKRKARRDELCVLHVDPDVLDIEGTVIATGNASSGYIKFLPSPNGLEEIEKDLVYAEYWTHPNQIESWRRTAARSAEVLVPHRVDPSFVVGAYVCSDTCQAHNVCGRTDLPISVDAHLFFL